MWRIPLLVLVAVGLSGCGDDDEALTAGDSSVEPAGEYRSVEVTEDGVPKELVAGTTISLRFDDGSLRASAGCNQMGGDHTIDDGVLRVGALSTTEMGCDPARAEQDRWLATFLSSAPTIEPSEDGFTLDGGSVTVRFVVREVVEPDVELVGPTWRVSGFIDGDVAMSTSGTEGHLVFSADGTVHASDGCNEMLARYELDGDRLHIGVPESDGEACPDADFQERVRAVFGTTVLHGIEARNLTLVADDGRGVTFTAER